MPPLFAFQALPPPLHRHATGSCSTLGPEPLKVGDGGGARLWRAGLPEGIVSPTFDAAIRSQSAAMIVAYGNRLEGARRRRIIDSAGPPAPYGAVVPQRTRIASAAVYGLAITGRRAVRAASPCFVGFVRPLVRPTSGGAVGLRPAGLEVPTPHDTPPAPDFPVRPEPAGMEDPGVDDLERAVRRRRLAQKFAVEP